MNRDSHDGAPPVAFPAMQIVVTASDIEHFVSLLSESLNDLGETEYGRLDAVVGALTMEEWYIKLDPRRGELDLSGLRKREFTEY